jgi:hypothetical protein
MALGIDSDARNFAKIHAGRKLQKIGNGIKGNLGDILLRDGRRGEQQKGCK